MMSLICHVNVHGVLPLVILEDPTYPALPWLMKPFQEMAHTTTAQKTYNYRQSRARMVVENAFGILKGRWWCLLKRLDFKLKNPSHIVSACVLYTTCVKSTETTVLQSGRLKYF